MQNHPKAALVLRFLRGRARLLVLSLACSMLCIVLGAMTPQVIKAAVDCVLGDAPLPAGFGFLAPAVEAGVLPALLAAAATLAFLALCNALSDYAGRMALARASEGFIKAMRDALFSHIQRLPFAWHVRHQTGEIIQRCTSDVEVVRSFVVNQLTEVVRTVFMVAFYLGLMLSMNAKLSLVALVFLPIVAGYSMVFYTRIARRFRTADEAEGELTSAVQENLTGVRVVRAFGRERFEVERFDERNERFSALWIHLGRLLSYYWCIGDLITSIQIITVVCAGAYMAVAGEISLGMFLAFVSYNQSLIWPVRGLGRILSEMSKASVSIERVRYILDAQPEVEPERALTPPLDGDIRFEHVTFGYGGQDVLRDVSFTIPAGSTLGILGGTGSGKSTLVHLLDRLYDLPDGGGRITIGGVDVRDIRRSHLRRGVGLVLQEPFLFSRTVRENILAPDPQAGEDALHEAAHTACVDEAIEGFADGYDTVVGERGVTLSGGQKQRVAIARMLMQRAPIMLFDDSLSAVDAQTDQLIRTRLRERLSGATVVLISHRVTTLMQADHILVLDGGRIAQSGTHEELIAQPGLYRQIYDIQMSAADRALLEHSGEAAKE